MAQAGVSEQAVEGSQVPEVVAHAVGVERQALELCQPNMQRCSRLSMQARTLQRLPELLHVAQHPLVPALVPLVVVVGAFDFPDAQGGHALDALIEDIALLGRGAETLVKAVQYLQRLDRGDALWATGEGLDDGMEVAGGQELDGGVDVFLGFDLEEATGAGEEAEGGLVGGEVGDDLDEELVGQVEEAARAAGALRGLGLGGVHGYKRAGGCGGIVAARCVRCVRCVWRRSVCMYEVTEKAVERCSASGGPLEGRRPGSFGERGVAPCRLQCNRSTVPSPEHSTPASPPPPVTLPNQDTKLFCSTSMEGFREIVVCSKLPCTVYAPIPYPEYQARSTHLLRPCSLTHPVKTSKQKNQKPQRPKCNTNASFHPSRKKKSQIPPHRVYHLPSLHIPHPSSPIPFKCSSLSLTPSKVRPRLKSKRSPIPINTPPYSSLAACVKLTSSNPTHPSWTASTPTAAARTEA